MKKQAYLGSFYFLAIMFSYQFIFSLSDPLTNWGVRIFFLVTSIACIVEIVKRHRKNKLDSSNTNNSISQ